MLNRSYLFKNYLFLIVIIRETFMLDSWGDSDYYFGTSLDVIISKLGSYVKNDSSIKTTKIPTLGYILDVLE